MNISGIFGFISAICVMTFVIAGSHGSAKVFLDPHGIVIVLGGTLTVALLCFPFHQLFGALKIVTGKMIGKIEFNYVEMIDVIVATSQVYRSNPKASLDQIGETSHPFFKEGMQMLVEYGFNSEDLDRILQNSIDGKKKRDHDDAKVWHTVSRFPPAFGLMGATVGMISLLQGLGEPGAQDKIGGSMATALVATFYGIAAANLLFIPIAEKIHEVSAQDMIMRNLIKEGILMIQEKRHPILISEYLKSFLAEKDRIGGVAGEGDKKAA
jgi:chemotaxis protein MotA